MNPENNITAQEALVTAYCKAWNNLDISYIPNCLTDDFEYSSQMVLETMHGKDQYVNYLKEKFVAFV